MPLKGWAEPTDLVILLENLYCTTLFLEKGRAP
jgi:hypothetical protein